VLVVSLLAVLLPLAPVMPAHAVGLGAVVGIGGTAFDTADGIAADASGNIYVTGLYTGTVDFDRSAARNDDTLVSTLQTGSSSIRSRDVYIAKYAPSGPLVWVRSVGGPGTDEPHGIGVDPNGNVYVTGEFEDTADFNPSSNATSRTSSGAQDVFVLKLTADGSFGWATTVGGAFTDRPAGIIVNSGGGTYVTGGFFGTADFDHTAASTNDTITSLGGEDGFLLSLDANGNYGWVRQLGGPGDQAPSGLAFGVSGIYITGSFAGSMFAGGSHELNSVGGTDMFLASYSPAGILRWSRSVGGASTDRGNAVAADGFGNIYVTGIFQGLVDFDPGAGTFNVNAQNGGTFVLRLDALTNGAFVQVGTSAAGNGASIRPFAIALDPSNTGSVYLAGSFNGTGDFDFGAGTLSATAVGFEDGFVLKMNADLSPVYVRTFGASGVQLDFGGVVSDGLGNVLTAGLLFGGTPIDFDPGPGTSNLADVGGGDGVELRLSESPPANSIPGAQIVAKGSTKVLSAATFNPITISAPDAGTGLRVLVAAIGGGTISLSTTAGLTFQAGDGTADPTMTFTGTQAAVNAALDGLRYTPQASYTGPAGIQVRSGLASGTTGSVQNTFSQVNISVVDGSCGPRPQVKVQSVKASGQLQVTLSTTAFPGAANPLAGLTFGVLRNARVTLGGQPVASNQPVALGPNTTQVTFTVERATPGQAVTVPLTAVDVCGPWQTFVGAGTSVSGL
jgi:hypothetical protein